MLRLTDKPKDAPGSDPEALIEEARQLQSRRARRRNIALQITAVLVVLGVTQLERGSSSAPPAPQQPPPSAAQVPTVTHKLIVLERFVPHLPVEKRTVETWVSSAAPDTQRAFITISGGHRFEVGTSIRHDKTLGLEQVFYLYDASTDTIYRAGITLVTPVPAGILVVPTPAGIGPSSVLTRPVGGKQVTPKRFYRVVVTDPDTHREGTRTYRGRRVYVVALTPRPNVKQTFYFDTTTFQVVLNEINAYGVRDVESTVFKRTLAATQANLARTSLTTAHPHAHIVLQAPLRIKQLAGDAFYPSGQHDG